MAFAYGLDVSIWDKVVTWSKIQQQGFSFVFIKSSQADWEDAMFKSHWAGAKAAGLLRGAYHFFTQAADPLKQAQVVLDLLKDDPGELPPVVDVEWERRYNTATKAIYNVPIQSKARYAGNLLAVLTTIEKGLNRKPLVYTGAGFWNETLSLYGKYPDWAPAYPLWVANYVTLPFTGGSILTANNISQVVSDIEQGKYKSWPLMPKSWPKYNFWQFSGDAYYLDGLASLNEENQVVKAKADLNIYAGTLDQLLTWANVSQPQVTPADVTPPPPVVTPPLNLTNQAMINIYFKAFGEATYWDVVQRAGLADMANHRNDQYAGPGIDNLPLTADEKVALKKALGG